MYVKVKFFRKSAMGYVGREYTYETDLPLHVMDKVVVPAGAGGKNRAIVTAVDVPEIDINPAYFPLKRITEYDEEVTEDGNN